MRRALRAPEEERQQRRAGAADRRLRAGRGAVPLSAADSARRRRSGHRSARRAGARAQPGSARSPTCASSTPRGGRCRTSSSVRASRCRSISRSSGWRRGRRRCHRIARISVYRVRLPLEGLPASRLVLTTSARVFTRQVTIGVEHAPDRRRRDPWFETLATSDWAHADQESPAPALTMAVRPLDGRDVLPRRRLGGKHGPPAAPARPAPRAAAGAPAQPRAAPSPRCEAR